LIASVGLAACGVAVFAEQLGLGMEAARGMFGWRRIFLLAAGAVVFTARGGQRRQRLVLSRRAEPRLFTPAPRAGAISVGGTSLTLDEENRIADEIPWNNRAFAPRLGLGGGGGFSRLLRRPAFQRDLGAWGDHRGYPDLALVADAYPGIAIHCNLSPEDICDPSRPGNPFHAGFGTSAATPLFAGIVALANQPLLAAGRPPLGFVNPLLYRLGRSGGQGILRDIVEGSNEVLAGMLPCVPGLRPGLRVGVGERRAPRRDRAPARPAVRAPPDRDESASSLAAEGEGFEPSTRP
jgi:hypothetical protein